MLSAEAIVKKLNQNKIFKFLSSVKLAVPLMLVLSALVGWGTILESHYNAEYSAMYLYKTGWFSCVLILLWINIFCATISRIPFKKHHTGFVITHIGLLTLLIGGFMTNTYGIDGQLSVTEGQSSSTVVLPNLMFGYQLEGSPAPMTVKFTKSISAKNESDLSEVNENLGSFFKVVEYIPFAKVEKVYKTGQKVNDEVALSFMLKSNFFNVNEWLHTQTNPVMQLGPATLKIVKTSNIDEVEKPHMKSKKRVVNSVTPPEPARAPQSTTDQIVISDFSSGKPVKTISLSNLQKKSIEVNGAKISLVKYYRAAVVAANKLEENLDPSANNPALELKVEKGGKSVREILYGKFDQFSLNKDGVFGLKFVFKSSDVAPVAADAQPAAHQSAAVAQTAPKNEAAVAAHAAAGVSAEAAAAEGAPPMQAPDMSQMGTRVIEFKVNPQDPKRVRVTLYKNDEFVATQVLSEGQNFDTPWMGMKVFLGTVQVGAEETSEVVPINPEQRSNLPPAAAKIRLADGT
ncbi:MAG: cytochrome c biogenesis protein ResB, partial [Pseudobdellovibrio sp.]